ncbi:J domain-containing protein [Ichthyenterobacterium magnum]|uniref:DnaJ-like protein n=1 Tax=Ichthyenterobacterium magnum TaxID=1230530 RepID=A0A420DUY3_9FLAO|nr:J domain-containing protein [Ichthyenterobacterium magnum]RKE97937.1 DnaJ-like protein [Ichthyenterobacterium magnum]
MLLKNHYHLLGIEPSSDINTIKKAFRKEIAIYHPEKNKTEEAAERFEGLILAFDILSHPEKRKTYDKLLSESLTNKPAVIEQKEEQQYKEWKKEAKTKSKKYKSSSLDDLLLLDLFFEAGIHGLLDSTDGLLDGIGDVLGEGLGGVFDLF